MRQDIPLAQQLVQSNHATFEVARRFHSNPEITPSCVVIGVPDTAALHRVIEKLRSHDIQHQAFHEPDFGIGWSSVTTMPLDQPQRDLLRNYRPWREENTNVA